VGRRGDREIARSIACQRCKQDEWGGGEKISPLKTSKKNVRKKKKKGTGGFFNPSEELWRLGSCTAKAPYTI